MKVHYIVCRFLFIIWFGVGCFFFLNISWNYAQCSGADNFANIFFPIACVVHFLYVPFDVILLGIQRNCQAEYLTKRVRTMIANGPIITFTIVGDIIIDRAPGYCLQFEVIQLIFLALMHVSLLITCWGIYSEVYYYLYEKLCCQCFRLRWTTYCNRWFPDEPEPQAIQVGQGSDLTGMTEEEIAKLMKFVMSPKYTTCNTTCAICASDMLEGETVICLPLCEHTFHKDCLLIWLRKKAECPIGRRAVRESMAKASPVLKTLQGRMPEEVHIEIQPS